VSAAQRPTVAAPADPGLVAFERGIHDSGEWRARMNNLTGLVGQDLLRVVAVMGEFRIIDRDDSIVGTRTKQDGFNGSLLLALRTLTVAPEADSLGYVWTTREAAERCLRHVNHRVYTGRS
jgi:hypothetical protein